MHRMNEFCRVNTYIHHSTSHVMVTTMPPNNTRTATAFLVRTSERPSFDSFAQSVVDKLHRRGELYHTICTECTIVFTFSPRTKQVLSESLFFAGIAHVEQQPGRLAELQVQDQRGPRAAPLQRGERHGKGEGEYVGVGDIVRFGLVQQNVN